MQNNNRIFGSAKHTAAKLLLRTAVHAEEHAEGAAELTAAAPMLKVAALAPARRGTYEFGILHQHTSPKYLPKENYLWKPCTRRTQRCTADGTPIGTRNGKRETIPRTRAILNFAVKHNKMSATGPCKKNARCASFKSQNTSSKRSQNVQKVSTLAIPKVSRGPKICFRDFGRN